MKKVVSLMMIALLVTAVLTPSGALAAPGDASLFFGADGMSSTIYIYHAAAIGSTAYMIGEEDGSCVLYAISAGETEARAYPFSETDQAMAYAMKLLALDEKPFVLNMRDGRIYEISLEGDRLALSEAMELEWEKMLLGGSDSGEKYPREIRALAVSGDSLYMTAYDEDWTGIELISFSLTDGGYRVVCRPERYLGDLIAGRDGKLLTAVSDEEDWAAPKMLCEISTEDGTLTELVELGGPTASGLVYDEAQDRVIYCMDGTIYATDMDGTTAELASVPLSSASDVQGGVGLLDGGYYFMSSYEGTIIKNLDPEYKPSRTLTIRTAYMETDQAYFQFGEEHPEAAIKVLTGEGNATADEVTQAIMSGSSEADIYYLNVNSAAYQALIGRGYAADLSGSETLAGLIDRMFPVFKAALTEGEKIVAFPKEINAQGYKITTAMAEEIGLSEEDYPDTWEKLLDLVERWDEEYSKEFPEKALFDPYETANMKETLFNMLLNEQVVLMNRPGAEAAVDTPFMRDILNRLDSMNFSAFATDQDFSQGYSWNGEDVLLDDWGIALPVNMYREEGKDPLLLAFSEDEEALIGVNMYVYVVNPYSENIDLAIDYLEARADTMSEGLQATLLTDWTEPIRSPYFESNLKQCDKLIQETEDALLKAGDDEKQMYESQLGDLKSWRENILAGEFLWTEEQLTEYRELTDHFVMVENQYFTDYSGAQAEEMQQLISRYVDGQMSAEQMLASLDQKLRMMQMEAGE